MLAVLLTAIAAMAVWAIREQAQPSAASQRLPEWASFSQANVSDVMIRHGKTSSIHLHRQGEHWVLLAEDIDSDKQPVLADASENAASKRPAADEDAVGHLLGDLSSMQIVRVVSHHAEYFSQLQLDEENGVNVQLRNPAGEILLDLWIGKPATDLVSTYARLQGAHEAVAVNRSLTWQVRRLPESWKAKPEAKAPAIPRTPVRDAYGQTI